MWTGLGVDFPSQRHTWYRCATRPIMIPLASLCQPCGSRVLFHALEPEEKTNVYFYWGHPCGWQSRGRLCAGGRGRLESTSKRTERLVWIEPSPPGRGLCEGKTETSLAWKKPRLELTQAGITLFLEGLEEEDEKKNSWEIRWRLCGG